VRHYRVTLADALAAHDAALTFGGRAGVVSLHSIESVIGRPYSGYHRPIANKAAALLHGVIRNHGFVDGNKRTALLPTSF
jgi:death-on-curing protein